MGLSLTQLLRGSICWCAAVFVISVPLLSQTREVIIDNAKVRVLREVVGSGETTEYDNPRLDRVAVWLQEGSGGNSFAGRQSRERLVEAVRGQVGTCRFHAPHRPEGEEFGCSNCCGTQGEGRLAKRRLRVLKTHGLSIRSTTKSNSRMTMFESRV